RRPLAVGALFVVLGVAGVLAYLRLPVNWFPNADIPTVNVVTAFPGAGPEEVELQVTRPIEEAVAGLSDADFVTSASTGGTSIVTVQFTEHANGALIATTVERQVDGVVGRLPAEAERPAVSKLDYGAAPVAQLAVVGDSLPPDELFRVADEVVRPRVESLP